MSATAVREELVEFTARDGEALNLIHVS
ncbi:MAG: hypothetical protein QOE28_2614, partial [Solirubrobacteraceae bacterium]|nr:hypothetical protein [Solirubrobacteraceae bacterium]